MTPQQHEILSILSDGLWHCSFEFRERMFIVDYRKRLSELKQEGLTLLAEPCRGCGRRHKAAPKWWRWLVETKKDKEVHRKLVEEPARDNRFLAEVI